MRHPAVRVDRPEHLRLMPDLRDDVRLEDDSLGLLRALPLALALSCIGWALLAAGAYGIYVLVA